MWRVALLLTAIPFAAHAEVCDKFEEGMGGAMLLFVLPGALLTWVAYLLGSRIGMALCLFWGVLVALVTLLTDFDADAIHPGLWDSEPWCRHSIIWFNIVIHSAAVAGVIVPSLLLKRLRRFSWADAGASQGQASG